MDTLKGKGFEHGARRDLMRQWMPGDKDDESTYEMKRTAMQNIMAINQGLESQQTKTEVRAVQKQNSELATEVKSLTDHMDMIATAQEAILEKMAAQSRLLEETRRVMEDDRQAARALGVQIRESKSKAADHDKQIRTMLNADLERHATMQATVVSLQAKLEKQTRGSSGMNEAVVRLDERINLIQQLHLRALSSLAQSGQVLHHADSTQEARNTAPQKPASTSRSRENKNTQQTPTHKGNNDQDVGDEPYDNAMLFAACQNCMRGMKKFNRLYKEQPPSEKEKHRFVRKFLESQTRRVADYLQDVILQHCSVAEPQLAPGHYGRNKIRLRININSVTWEDARAALNSLEAIGVAKAQRADDRERQERRMLRSSNDRQGSITDPPVRRELTSVVPDLQWTGEADSEL